MGNQLVGVAPAQIYPVEHYLTDHANLTFDQSLGSTRFFKVARARSREGLVVVKVFAVQDPSLPLAAHRDRLERVRVQLASCFNCLPFQKIILTDKAGLIMREYCKYSLYDRMSTRPFLSTLEKKWITFQVLCALNQCHKLGVCHGDIKLENIMLTSWTWVLLTDFASFKPTFLPEDNPADYSYFFDTSRRRLCYVAPERFVRNADNHHRMQGGDERGGGLLLNESPCKAGDLLPSMDIFSAGCALIELWNDGTPALDLSGLLAYRHSGDRPPSMRLAAADARLQRLLYSMTRREPSARSTAEIYLDGERGELFPEYFYSFLQSYMLLFSAQPTPPDEKVARVRQDIAGVVRLLTEPGARGHGEPDAPGPSGEREMLDEGFQLKTVRIADKYAAETARPAAARRPAGADGEPLVFVTSLVTSCVRGLRHCTSRLHALDVLLQLCARSGAETILDRILPYVVSLVHPPPQLKTVRIADKYAAETARPAAARRPAGADGEPLVFVTSLVTSCVRGLRHCTSRLHALDVLLQLCARSGAETILDRILPYVVSLVHPPPQLKTVRIADKYAAETARPAAARRPAGADGEPLVFVTSLVTSCVRGLRHCTSRLHALDVLLQLCARSGAETILDRILPYVIYLTHDPLARVRVAALNTLTRCLAMVDALPKSNTNVFPEYILAEVAPRATDGCLAVRVAVANNIAELAEIALRFLDDSQCMDNLKESAKINYESELSALHEMVRATVSSLLTDPQALVRRTLVENGITKLCVFFGKQKANDVILSHVVTFLNDKEEASLRACFFDCVVGVAAYVGCHCAPILLPLLQQGLTDQSEFVIAKALGATSSLAELGLLRKQTLCEYIAESVCYLAHPNMWIRHEICGLISCVASLLNPIDVNCKILPLVWPHLRHKLTQVDRPELLLESLVDPIPRSILDAVMKYRDINQLIETLRERRQTRLVAKQGTVRQYTETGHIKNIFRRLTSDGLTDHMEGQLLAMSSHLIKIQRAGSHTANQIQSEAPGRLVLTDASLSRVVSLDVGTLDPQLAPDKNYPPTRRTPKTSVSSVGEPISHMNTEWQHMFAQPQDSQHTVRDARHTSPASTLQSSGLSASTPLSGQSLSAAERSAARERSFVQYNMAPCRIELRSLTSRMQQKYMKSLRSNDVSIDGDEHNLPPPNWRPGNTLLAYLHEHRSSVNRLATLPTGGLFGSCSNDGTVRLWQAGRLEGNSLVNKSKSMYNRGAGPVIALAPCESGQSFAAATQEGSIFVLRLESGSSRMTLSQCRQLDASEEGGAADVACCTGGFSANLITYATLYAGIVGWDLRAPGDAFRLRGDLRRGVYTCLYAHPAGWLCVGTCSGAVELWDLRFQLPITTVTHPNGERVRRVCGWGGSRVWACGGRDAGAWCMESGARTHAVWPHAANSPQPLLYDKPSSQYVSAMWCGRRGGGGGGEWLVTGGSDQRLRCWELAGAADSRVLVRAPADREREQAPFKYSGRLIDGTSVVQEWCRAPPPPADEAARRGGARSHHHAAPITDVAVVRATKHYLVSSSADGVINVWK